MESESRRQCLIDALRHLTPEMKETLREEGLEQKDRPDFVWHSAPKLLLEAGAKLIYKLLPRSAFRNVTLSLVPNATDVVRIRYKLLRLATAQTSENFVGL
jgi:hypothetical protein